MTDTFSNSQGSDGPSHHEEIQRNARDLRQGVVINSLGFVIKLSMSGLLILVVRLYGPGQFGIFALSEAMIWILLSCCSLGLNQGLLWWVPRQSSQNQRSQILPCAIVVVGLTTVVMLVLLVFPPAVLVLWNLFGMLGSPKMAQLAEHTAILDSLRLMVLGLVPMTLADLLNSAIMGKRRLQSQVFISAGLVPLFFVGGSIVLYFCGLKLTGLAWAFLLSRFVGLTGTLIVFGIYFRGIPWPKNERLFPTRELVRYSWPMWVTQISTFYRLRMDLLAVSVIVRDPVIIGVYAVVVKLAYSVWEIARSFSPLVLALASKAAAGGNRRELAAGYSYATMLVMFAQIPVFVLLAVCGHWILSLYGEEFTQGTTTAMVLCGSWLLFGLIGMSGLIVNGFGRSKLTLWAVLLTIAVEGLLLHLFVPRYGMLGAAWAVALAQTVLFCTQLMQMRIITGAWNYTTAVLRPIMLGVASSAVMVVALLLLSSQGVPAPRAIALGIFFVIYGVGVIYFWRRGLLNGAGSDHKKTQTKPEPIDEVRSAPLPYIARASGIEIHTQSSDSMMLD